MDGGRRPASSTGATTSKVKDQGRKVTWSLRGVGQWPINRKRIVVISPKFALGTLTKYQDAYDWQSSRSKVSSHRLYVSSLPLLNLGNKMLYLCHWRWAGAYCVGRTRRPHFLLLFVDAYDVAVLVIRDVRLCYSVLSALCKFHSNSPNGCQDIEHLPQVVF